MRFGLFNVRTHENETYVYTFLCDGDGCDVKRFSGLSVDHYLPNRNSSRATLIMTAIRDSVWKLHFLLFLITNISLSKYQGYAQVYQNSPFPNPNPNPNP